MELLGQIRDTELADSCGESEQQAAREQLEDMLPLLHNDQRFAAGRPKAHLLAWKSFLQPTWTDPETQTVFGWIRDGIPISWVHPRSP